MFGLFKGTFESKNKNSENGAYYATGAKKVGEKVGGGKLKSGCDTRIS